MSAADGYTGGSGGIGWFLNVLPKQLTAHDSKTFLYLILMAQMIFRNKHTGVCRSLLTPQHLGHSASKIQFLKIWSLWHSHCFIKRHFVPFALVKSLYLLNISLIRTELPCFLILMAAESVHIHSLMLQVGMSEKYGGRTKLVSKISSSPWMKLSKNFRTEQSFLLLNEETDIIK